jgi:hypothetical protein
MSREAVTAAEGQDVSDTGDEYFSYKWNVVGRDVLVAYYFDNDRLVSDLAPENEPKLSFSIWTI